MVYQTALEAHGFENRVVFTFRREINLGIFFVHLLLLFVFLVKLNHITFPHYWLSGLHTGGDSPLVYIYIYILYIYRDVGTRM